ncbi:MAG TPA: dephospho-CoA kinase [Vicinamibacterales bacterium]|nr:dephospho-CoA kinase [Vicinamibacterales bacterium]
MLKVALTGGIATGKSHVLEQFRRRGVPCLDADDLAHGVEAAGTEATAAIAARFGPGVLAADGSVNRARLGPIVFADPAARRELEAIVHPAVYRAIEAGMRAFELTGAHAFAVIDVPLLFETGAERRFDRVIVTACSAEHQIARLTARGLAEEAARQRLAAQWPTEKKVAGADFLVRTDGTFAETDRQVEEIYDRLSAVRPVSPAPRPR